METNRVVKVGLLGRGNVGGALAYLVASNADVILTRAGVGIEIARVAVRDLDRHVADGALPKSHFTSDPAAIVADPEIDVIVEVMGGIEPARTLILAALAAGKPVVTANKELLANFGFELAQAAEAAGVDLLFEASVGGGIPLIRPLRESLAGDRIRRVLGIVNGTTNYILTKMTESGASFADALAEAQALGYAEADPTADVEGHDAAAKAAIIAMIAFSAQVTAADVPHEGITAVTAADISSARELGYVIKLLAVAEEISGAIAVRVYPAMVPTDHPLATVSDSFNAVFIEGEAAGELMLYGRGAGGNPTAVAVLGDVIDAAKNLVAGHSGATLGTLIARPICPVDDLTSEFYLAMDVVDRPGVLAAVAKVFGDHGVSVRLVRQQGSDADARLIFVTHAAREADIAAAVAEVRDLDMVHLVCSVLRVIGARG